MLNRQPGPKQSFGSGCRPSSPRGPWPGDRVALAGFGEDATLDHSLGQLLDEQRDAIGAIDDLVGNFLGNALPTYSLEHFSIIMRLQNGLKRSFPPF